jgi:lysophospholipase L1-like esterase
MKRPSATRPTALLAALLSTSANAATLPPAATWVTTWFAPMVAVPPTTPGQYEGQTIRTYPHLSVGGPAFRLRISNQYGTDKLILGGVHVAAPGGRASIYPPSDTVVTFSGRTDVSIPLGATAISDPIRWAIPAQKDLAVSIYVTKSSVISDHQSPNQYSYVASGNMLSAPNFRGSPTIYDRPFLTGVDVVASPIAGSVITLGDSITDGSGSDYNKNDRWPDLLAAKLTGAYGNRVGVGNAGIAGNAIISEPAPTNPVATARINQDVLSQPGRRWVILLEGINDIGNTLVHPEESPSGEDLIAADRELIATAHGAGLKIYGATLLPYDGAIYYTTAGDQKREELNTFIRTSGEFDAVIDTDAALRDPSDPDRLLPAYDSGDHLHPNEAGDQAIANTVDLSLFPPP